MSVTPPEKGGSFLQKKVMGVPVLYLLLGFVVILAALAWKMKGTSSTPAGAAADPNAAPAETAGDTLQTDPGTAYPALPLGTVSTQPGQPTGNGGDTAIADNDQWLSKGTMFLAGKGVGPGDAQQALSAYLDGNELTFQQGQWRDMAIRELGVPPFPVNIGGTQVDVARMQGALPRTHIVKNVNENTATKLASLYYNRTDAFAVKAITDVNGTRASYNVGDSVEIPLLPKPVVTPPPVVKPVPKPVVKPPVKAAPHPTRYYTVQKGDTLSGIAKRYYGNGSASKYMVIARANRIKNPNLIYAGSRIVIPYI